MSSILYKKERKMIQRSYIKSLVQWKVCTLYSLHPYKILDSLF